MKLTLDSSSDAIDITTPEEDEAWEEGYKYFQQKLAEHEITGHTENCQYECALEDFK